MTVIKRLDTTFTDADDLPTATPSTGVPGAVHQWWAADVAGVDGDVITTVPARAGGVNLTQPTAGARGTLEIEGGVKMLRFDGVNDEFVPAATLDPDDLQTITVVARVRAPQGTQQGILLNGTGVIQRGGGSPAATTNVHGGGTGATTTAVAVDPTSTTTFHVFSFALGTDQEDNPVRSVTVDGTTAAVNGDAVPNTVRIGQGFAGTFGNIDVLGVITWPFALTTTQRAAVRTQMQALFPGIVA